jgi:hypothetical protein
LGRGWWWIAAAVSPAWVALYAALLAAPVPSWFPAFGDPFVVALRVASIGFVVPFVVPALCFPVFVLVNLVQKVRRREALFERERWGLGLGGFALTAAVAWSSPFAAQPLYELRYAGARASTQHGDVIVAAINEYASAEARYPTKLADLVPTYLPSLPSAGMLAYSSWEYRLPDAEKRRLGCEENFGEFELSVSMHHGRSGDRLIYWPNGTYPDRVYSGITLRLGAWAYVRE